jgi:uncharacterized protein (DUF1330 family)
MYIEPDVEQIRVLAGSDLTGPVVMLNLLKFAPDGGRASYLHYGEGVAPLLDRAGARILWQGRADSVVIGDSAGDGWDAVVLVEYPSRKAFLDMVLSPEYTAIADRRTAALADSRLIACTGQVPLTA